jgi:hypothetical protein
MRIILVISVFTILFSGEIFSQNDFRTLDWKTYDYYLKGDYRNLRKTADTMLLHGMDYYYLRMRLGLLAYKKQLYSAASKNLSRAIEFNSLDTVSREYIYNCYLFSGRKADADLYLVSIPPDKRNTPLKSSYRPVSSEFYISSSFAAHDQFLYETNSLNYEAVKNSIGISAGAETHFSNRFTGTIAYTSFHKTGTSYSPANPAGKNLNFYQNQVYAKLTGSVFPGWDISGFVHLAFYNEALTLGMPGNRITSHQPVSEYAGGFGLAKSWWKIRTNASLSISNLGYSKQYRGEGYLTWLPKGNLNLYFTTGWMGQTDSNWGGTYQVSQEAGFKVHKILWLETGAVNGNSFFYVRNQGSILNNSFQIPSLTIYSNLILLPGNHLKFIITPYFAENQIYSWDLNAYTRTNLLNINSFGGTIKLIYKFK